MTKFMTNSQIYGRNGKILMDKFNIKIKYINKYKLNQTKYVSFESPCKNPLDCRQMRAKRN